MKQGQWATEWKRIRRELDASFKKLETGKVFDRTYESELKPCEKILVACDRAFAEYADCDTTDEKRDVVKRISNGHDEYRKARANHKKALAKIAKRSSPDIAKAVEAINLKNDPIETSLGDTSVAMLNFVSHAAREEKKIENISKSLSDEVKQIKKFVIAAQGDKKGKVYSNGVVDRVEELHDLLVTIDKMVRKKKEIENSKAPPKKLLAMAKELKDPDRLVVVEEDDGTIDKRWMRTVLADMLKTATEVETWRKKTWPK